MKLFVKLLLIVGIGLIIGGIPTMISCFKNRNQASFTFAEYEKRRPENHWIVLTDCRLSQAEAVTFKTFGKGKQTYTYIPIRGIESSSSESIVAFLAIESLEGEKTDQLRTGSEGLEIYGMVRVGFKKDDLAEHELMQKYSVAENFVIIEEGAKPNWVIAFLWPLGFVAIGTAIRMSRTHSGRITKRKVGDSGGFKNLSQASTSTNFYPRSIRLLWYQARILPQLILWSIFIAILILGGGIFLGRFSLVFLVSGCILGGLVFLVAVLAIGLACYGLNPMRENFKNGLLTAGLIDDRKRHSIIHIGVLSKGGPPEEYIYGVRRIDHDGFPYRSVGNDNQIACVSVFDDSIRHSGSWHNFNPTPVAFGTSDRNRIQQCLDVVSSSEDGNYFEILESFMSHQAIARDSTDLYVCDREGNLVEVRPNKKQENQGANL